MRHERTGAAAALADETSPLNEYGPIRRLVLRHARDAYRSQATLDATWQAQDFIDAPNFDEALGEFERFVEVLQDADIEIEYMPPDDRVGLASIYSRDSSIVTKAGVILCNMRNACRAEEPAVVGEFLGQLGVPVLGSISGEGVLEGGDLIWLDERTCAVAQGYRTNAEGIRQLERLLGPGVHVEVVPLPHHHGPAECLHLMSIISPLDADLAVVYSPLMPVPFRNWLLERGMRLVEVPDDEQEPTMGCNVLALAPRKCLAIDGNTTTRARLEAAGCEVIAYKGAEISIKGSGGPTCLTRPLIRG